MGMIMLVMMSMAVGLIMVMGMIMLVMMSMAVGMIMVMGMIMTMCRLGLTGPAYFHRIASVSASAGVAHSYSFCSTSKDFICNSVPLISLIPGF